VTHRFRFGKRCEAGAKRLATQPRERASPKAKPFFWRGAPPYVFAAVRSDFLALRAVGYFGCLGYDVVPVKNNDIGESSSMKNPQGYWNANLKILLGCLVVWFVVSFGFGIIIAEPLNAISIGGYQLGFWFAQQGSIYIFLALIFFYVWRMNKLDREFDVHED
jgi:putative solute:sodium symporter small subunit